MKVLKNAGFKPEWVELVRPHCTDLRQPCRRMMRGVSDGGAASGQGVEIRAAVAALREGGQAPQEEEVVRVNALIAKHNGLAPAPGLHIAPLVAGGGEGGGVVGKGAG